MRNFIFLVITSFALSACGLLPQKESNPLVATSTVVPKNTSTPIILLADTPIAIFTKITPSQTLTPTLSQNQQASCGHTESGGKVFIDETPSFSVREGPGCEYNKFQGQITKTDPLIFFDVLGKNNEWLLVDFCNNIQGWVFAPAIDQMNFDVSIDDLSLINPPATPDILPTSLPVYESTSKAKTTLIHFFELLNNKEYGEAVRIFSGGYGIAIMWNPSVDPHDYPSLLMRACEWNGFQCYTKIRRIVSETQISSLEYHFIVEFSNKNGSLYQRKASQNSMTSQFLFRVVRDCNGQYFVVDWPFYEQYGG